MTVATGRAVAAAADPLVDPSECIEIRRLRADTTLLTRAPALPPACQSKLDPARTPADYAVW